MPHHLRHHWLRDDESIVWHAMANRGPDNTRQVGGTLFLTDQRLLFEPQILERITEEHRWEAERSAVLIRTGPGLWDTHVPLVRDIALRHHVEVLTVDGEHEDFWVTHLGDEIERLAATS